MSWSSFQRYLYSRIPLYSLSVLINIAGLSADDTNFIQAAVIIVIIFSVVRLILELVRFIRQLHIFFANFDTWVEVPLFIFAIIFAAVFDRECLCPRDWQWQVGIAAVFLVWVDLILYMRRMRVLGKCNYNVTTTSCVIIHRTTNKELCKIFKRSVLAN